MSLLEDFLKQTTNYGPAGAPEVYWDANESRFECDWYDGKAVFSISISETGAGWAWHREGQNDCGTGIESAVEAFRKWEALK